MDFSNSYQDEFRANAYATLAFHNTYHLAFRDLPTIFHTHVKGKKAIDFGCGTGRSTRFLQNQGFEAIGIDISKEMIQIAKKIDPKGKYHLISDGDYSMFPDHSYDLILSAFTFDNIPLEKKIPLFKGLSHLLKNDGVIINIVSSPELYTNEWASFSTKDFPENINVKDGDIVQIITTDFEDKRPCKDIFCTPDQYQKIYSEAKIDIVQTYKPLAKGDEPYQWIMEKTIAPWTIYILKSIT